MTDDPRRLAAAEGIYRAVLEAKRDVGDAALCDALAMLAADSGENRFRFAASVVRGTKLGRHAIDDKAALRRIAAYPADRRREAVGIVARQIAAVSDERVASIERRLSDESSKIKRTKWFYPPPRFVTKRA
jgi:hypothetical protein